MMSQHTNEPWGLDSDNTTILNEQLSVICDTALSSMNYGEDVENASRIVACVNACAGIPNSVLAVFTRPQCNILVSNELANEQLKKVAKQRDELLAAVKSLNYSASADSYNAKIVAAAIAKCEQQ